MMHFHTEDEVADWVVCRDSGMSTEIFDVEDHSQWLRARTGGNVWATPGRMQKHIAVWIAVPFWALALMVGPFPAINMTRGVRRYRRRKPKYPNGCRQCGYDLTGNVSGNCPECGSPAVQDRLVALPPEDVPTFDLRRE
jgi:hypothetical protein